MLHWSWLLLGNKAALHNRKFRPVYQELKRNIQEFIQKEDEQDSSDETIHRARAQNLSQDLPILFGMLKDCLKADAFMEEIDVTS
ncbi:hypothetical protein M422DRAFT_35813 [Sphaerobolus stellatus SS14]|uniref:Uncharacterized protein n=1 Tax=Sphaerobolus stellatus (strain SS14) TaxID=990650 RepID=A0A0C9UT46_SPHS4|nr:hypothetical protein M422DRAFT_35813 [Sphaerobolus stellatus SS14]